MLTFIQRKQQERKRIIYFAMGSSGNPRMLRKILFFLQKQSDLAVIAPIDYLLDDIQSDSEDLLITEYLSSHLLHEFIDFSFIHGGEGTVQTACESGKPFIGVGMQFEQSCNIDYCVKYGNAIALTKPVTEKNCRLLCAKFLHPRFVSRHARRKPFFQ